MPQCGSKTYKILEIRLLLFTSLRCNGAILTASQVRPICHENSLRLKAVLPTQEVADLKALCLCRYVAEQVCDNDEARDESGWCSTDCTTLVGLGCRAPPERPSVVVAKWTGQKPHRALPASLRRFKTIREQAIYICRGRRSRGWHLLCCTY
jgi:hypothetical protein